METWNAGDHHPPGRSRPRHRRAVGRDHRSRACSPHGWATVSTSMSAPEGPAPSSTTASPSTFWSTRSSPRRELSFTWWEPGDPTSQTGSSSRSAPTTTARAGSRSPRRCLPASLRRGRATRRRHDALGGARAVAVGLHGGRRARQVSALDDVFGALADPTRRALFERLLQARPGHRDPSRGRLAAHAPGRRQAPPGARRGRPRDLSPRRSRGALPGDSPTVGGGARLVDRVQRSMGPTSRAPARRRSGRHGQDGRVDAVEAGDVVGQDGRALLRISPAVCSASISWLHGHVESLCGKSLAHISRRQFMSSAWRNADQSSWNVA